MTNKPLLSIENLAISFDDDQTRVVDDVCLKLESNQTVALVGESGSGKSVTAHSIMGLLPYPLASHPCGKILFEDRDLLSLSKQGLQKLRGNKISMIFQEPLTALNPLQKVGKQIAEIITIHQGLSGEKLQQQTLQLLKQVKIINPEQKLEAYPHQLSGGQRQRIMIAMAIANKPDILIADEPTTALDVTVQKDIIELLLELQREMGMAIILITHDLNIVKQVADYICVMHQGRIIEKQAVDGLFSNPQAEYTKMLLNAEPDRSPSPINLQLSGQVLTTSKLAVDYALPKPWFFSKPRNFRALHTADIQLNKGQTLGIVGESGSGKSTLAMSLIKLVQSEGDIHLNGQSVNQLDQRAFRPYRNQIQIVFQDPFGSLSPRLPIADIIGEGLRVHRQLSDEQIDKIVIDVLNEVQLDPEIRHRYPHECSGGQRQRIAIARAIVLEPEILILDEPTSALDRAVQIQILSLLKKLQQKYHMSYIFISHDLKVIRSISHHILVMKDGKIIERGASNDIFTRPQKSYTQELLQAASQ